MKRTRLLNYAVLTVLAFLGSCQKVDTSVEGASLYAIIEQETGNQTYIDANYNVCWQKGDQAAVFRESTVPAKYQIADEAEGKTDGSLNPVSDGSSDNSLNTGTELAALVAYYPYTEGLDVKLTDPQKSSYILSGVAVPEIQKYDAKHTFAQHTLPMASISIGGQKDVVFRKVCGVLELHFYGNFNIKAISLEGLSGEQISGAGSLLLNMDEAPVISMDETASGKIILDCGQGIQLNPGKDQATSFRIVVPPTVFTKGFKIAVTDVDGTVKSLESKSEQKIQRSRILDMPAIELTKSAENTDNNKTFTINSNGKEVSFTMVAVQGGTFMMGAQSSDPTGTNYDSEAFYGEGPVHEVTLTQDYYIGQTEVTQELWEAVMGSNPSEHQGTQCPVEQVSWDDIVEEFLPKLNQLNLQPGMTFSLPSEAQWEYAARGGNKSGHYKFSGSDNLYDVAWFFLNSSDTSHEVATKNPNELGIYDMNGNVWEWCADWYGDYSSESQNDPKGPDSGSDRVLRGASYGSRARYCRITYRDLDYSFTRDNYIGFRLVLSPQ